MLLASFWWPGDLMTCPCEDMKTVRRQHDSDGFLDGIWPAQRLRGLGIFQGIQVQGVWVHPRPLPPTPCLGLLLWLCVGSLLPAPFPAQIPAPASQRNPAGPWGCFSLSKHTRGAFAVFAVTAREEENCPEQDSTETLCFCCPVLFLASTTKLQH